LSSQVIISKSALVHNLRAYRRVIGNAKIMAVVKSNAYGHGLQTAPLIEPFTDWYGTASAKEAFSLRKLGVKKPILVLSFYDEADIRQALQKRISLVVYDLKQAKTISVIARKLKITAKIHLKVDTGTARLGIKPKEVAGFVDKLIKLPNLTIEGVFSHFAASEDDEEFTKRQNHLFNAVVEEMEWRGIDPIKHIACTAAGIVAKDSQHDVVRLGIGLYGLWPSDKARKVAQFELKPALTWQTKVIQVKELPKGASVGYDLTYTTKRATTLAVLPVGYYDGYDRKLSNLGQVMIRGKRCKVLGRVCMNLMMIDVTEIKDVKVGDKAELIGKEITADELAKKIGTINYEVASRINPLIERIYV